MINKDFFLKINIISLGSVLVLILVGSIVRSTGAGMGCPDWPECFGSYIPPTSVNQLPDDYLKIFKSERLQKNQRLASILNSLGYFQLGNKILNDPFIQREQEFNVSKAWIEYVNRLVGVLIGLLIFLNMIASFSLKKTFWLPLVGVLIFVLTGFQGWVGSLVVSTNLLKGFITFHMLLALLIVALLIWMYAKAKEVMIVKDKNLFIVSVILFFCFIPQIIMGTEVRSVVDELLVSESDRSNWISSLSSIFYYHRSYSWIVIIGSIAIFYMVRRKNIIELKRITSYLILMVGSIAIVGVIMTKFDFPFWTQPLHLMLATGIFSTLFYLTLRLKPT